MHCRTFSSISGLYPLDVRGTSWCDHQKYLQPLPNVLGYLDEHRTTSMRTTGTLWTFIPKIPTQGPSSSSELYLYYPHSVSNSKSGPQITLSFLCLLLYWIFKPERSKKTTLASILCLTSIASASGFRPFFEKTVLSRFDEKKKCIECLLYVGHCSGCSRASPKFLPSWGFHCSGRQKIKQ